MTNIFAYHTRRRYANPAQASQVKVRIGNRRNIVLSCEFHQNGKYFLSSDYQGLIHVSNADRQFEKLSQLKGHKLAVTEVHYSKDGTNIYSGSMDHTVVIWDAFRGVRKSVIIGHQDHVYTVQCSRTAEPMICSGSSDKTIRVWDVRQRSCGAMLTSEQSVAAVCFSSCGNYIFAGGFENGDITAWDIRQNDSLYLLTGHRLAVTGLSLSPCGMYLASCSADSTIRKWDVRSPAEVEREVQMYPLLQHDLSHVRRCAWSADGRLLTAGTTGRKGIVFHAASGAALRQLRGHKDTILDLAFHPTQPMLVSTGADKNVIVHKLKEL